MMPHTSESLRSPIVETLLVHYRDAFRDSQFGQPIHGHLIHRSKYFRTSCCSVADSTSNCRLPRPSSVAPSTTSALVGCSVSAIPCTGIQDIAPRWTQHFDRSPYADREIPSFYNLRRIVRFRSPQLRLMAVATLPDITVWMTPSPLVFPALPATGVDIHNPNGSIEVK